VGSETGTQAADRAAIETLIPHRDPFLLVDRVLDRTEAAIEVERFVDPALDCLRGHYPGHPLLPGVLIAETCFQAAALLLADPARPFAPGDPVPVLTRIEDARYRRMVRPGDTLRARVELVEALGTARWMKGTVTCDGERVLSIRFVVAEAPAPDAVTGDAS
jgi:3-hydroxyacyl-[acyl-carrier-protein] dehydratase